MKIGDQTGADPERVEAAVERLETVFCELEPGSAVFFHCNLLHRSDQNKSDDPRWAFICCYNSKENDPYKESRHPRYTPLHKWPDSMVLEIGQYGDNGPGNAAAGGVEAHQPAIPDRRPLRLNDQRDPGTVSQPPSLANPLPRGERGEKNTPTTRLVCRSLSPLPSRERGWGWEIRPLVRLPVRRDAVKAEARCGLASISWESRRLPRPADWITFTIGCAKVTTARWPGSRGANRRTSIRGTYSPACAA